MNENLKKHLKKNFDIVFKKLNLLNQAFTHSSYANENQNLNLSNNERLEFLGDAVLELLISKILYKRFPKLPEGSLTKLRAAIVCKETLAKLSKDCFFDHYVLLGKGEELAGGRNRITLLCDLFESFLGALYLDSNLESVESFLTKLIYPLIESNFFQKNLDHKTRLQEILQSSGNVFIEYRLKKEEGPSHERFFWVELYCDNYLIGEGKGKSKKLAEQAAAAEGLKNAKDNRKTKNYDKINSY